jgi:predicted MFS family arabinose efflux permease
MLNELAAGIAAGSISRAGLLVTYGAVILCIGSPLMSWATSRVDRRTLLAGSLLVLAIGHLASALADSYATVLAVRIAMMVAAAPFTPQAAGAIALLVPARERASAIAFVFLGWSLSVAAGLPIVKVIAAHLGWRASFGGLAIAAAIGFLMVIASVPGGLRGTAVSLQSWVAIARHRQIRLILLLTAVLTAGQFGVFTYLAPLLVQLCGASTGTIGAFFAVFGVMGFIGNVIATRVVNDLGALRTTFGFLVSTLTGVLLWSAAAGSLPPMLVGMALWGLGFAAINSMQQARLVAAEPALAGGSVALNTSAIYVGQAVGSALGGLQLANDLPLLMGPTAAVTILASLVLLLFTRSAGEPLPWRS